MEHFSLKPGVRQRCHSYHFYSIRKIKYTIGKEEIKWYL